MNNEKERLEKMSNNNKITPILVTRSSMPPMDEYIETIKTIWETSWITNMGPIHTKFEKFLKEYLKVKRLSLFTNGHLALELGIQAFGLTGEVITTPFTFASTTHAIVRNGLTPVFCDINPIDYTMDVTKIEALITEKTSAIIPVHVYGNICDMTAINAIAKKYNLIVIYDAAHTFGITVDSVGIGDFGDASMFSFHATKVFNTIEGGAFTFQDKKYEKILYNLKNFGIDSPEDVNAVGSNAKMNEFQAAMGICNLKYIEDNIAKRKKVVERYHHHFENIPGIKICSEKPGIKSNYAYFPVLFDKDIFGKSRDEVDLKLKANEIYPRKYFYPLVNTMACYNGQFDVNETPVAQKIAENVLTLPLYPDLAMKDVDRICDLILNTD